jgi:predicted GIY-YIG superfamily endonuclease
MNINFEKFINEKRKYNFWTKYDNLQKEADKYQTRGEFIKKNHSAYISALNKNLIDELFKNHPNQGYEINYRHNFWTKEILQKEVDKYKTRNEFRKKCGGAYSAAKTKKLLDELFKNHINNGYLDKEEWKENSYIVYAYELKDFNSVYIGLTNNLKRRDMEHLWSVKTKLSQFCKKHNLSYPKSKILEENLKSTDAQKKENYWIDFYKNGGWEMFNIAKPGSLGGIIKKWTKKKLQEEANKYKTRGELLKNNLQAYNAASDYKLLDFLFRNHINQGRTKNHWTKEKLQKEANKSKSRKDFRDNNTKAYNMAKEYKIMNDLFKNHPNQGYQK